VEFRLADANRDPAIFGVDANVFNPHRIVKAPILPFGHTFGTGVHTCLGRDLDGGAVPRADVDPETHPYGTITLLLRELFSNGARPDPAHPPQRSNKTERPNWGHYPIIFDPKKAWS
jgi:hypothetical protein